MESNQNIAEDEISLKEVIQQVKSFTKYIISKWKKILLVGMCFGVMGILISIILKPKYTATTTIMLDSGSSTSGMLSGALQLASQFGIGSTTGTEDKVIDVIQAKSIVGQALLGKKTIDTINDRLINHFITIYNFQKKLVFFDRYDPNITFDKDSMLHFSYSQDSVYNLIYDYIINKEILTVSKDDESLFITVNIESTSEEWAKYFCNALVSETESFYVNNMTKKQRQTVEVVQKTVDSTLTALTIAEDKYAKWKDASTRLIKMEGSIDEMRLQRDIQVLSTIYAAAKQNLEMAKFSLLNQTPFFQVITTPPSSLEKKETKTIIAFPVGFFIGVFFSVFYFFVRKIITNAIQ